MQSFLSHQDAWEAITNLALRCQTKSAAVAYVSSDVVIKFGDGDLLVTDASDNAALAGQTSGRLLGRARNRGARIVSVAALHAKVMLFDTTAVIGSANISARSFRQLIEAVVVTDTRDLVRAARTFIQELADSGDEVDDTRVQALIELESLRPRSATLPRRLGEAHIVFFRQILPGDLRKYERRSADAQTGGGARDLRIRRANVLWPLLRQMISEPMAEAGVTHGAVLSRLRGGAFDRTDVELWRPTGARRGELRIARFYDVPGWFVDSTRYQQETARGTRLFYVLEMDIFGSVFAKVLTDRQLAAGDPLIAGHLGNLIARHGGRSAVMGAVDLVRHVVVP